MGKRERTDAQIVRETAAEYEKKAQEAWNTYQETGIGRYETMFNKYNALATALSRDSDADSARSEAIGYKVKIAEVAGKYGSLRFMPDDVKLKVMDDLLREFNWWAKMNGIVSN